LLFYPQLSIFPPRKDQPFEKPPLYLAVFLSLLSCFPLASRAQEPKPDTVSVGIYITSIHDIDFRQKEYAVNFWLWIKYKKQGL
jgi:hypothetical protein